MSIRIKRSEGNVAPSSLDAGQLAYTEGTNKTLYIGTIAGGVSAIGGNADHAKLADIEAGAQVNTVTSVAGRTGDVTIDTDDLSSFTTDVDARIGNADITDLANVVITTPTDGQQLSYDTTSSKWINTAPSSGVTAFVQLNDAPSSFSGQGLKFVRVNTGADALEFVTDIDDGTF